MTIQQIMMNSPAVPTSDAVVIPATVLASDPSSPSAGVAFYASGSQYTITNGLLDLLGSWLLSGSASDFEIMAVIGSTTGIGTFSGTVNTWQSMSVNRSWEAFKTGTGLTYRVILNISIRLASTGTVLSTGQVELEASKA